MDSWEDLDAADILLSSISASYYKSAKRLAQKLEEAKVWRGCGDKQRVEKSNSKHKSKSKTPPSLRKDSASPRSYHGTPPHVSKWTTEQREEAAIKKSEEAAAAATVGLRKSKRATVPSERLLNADKWQSQRT